MGFRFLDLGLWVFARWRSADFLLLFLCTCLFAACGHQDGVPQSEIKRSLFVDDLGRQVYVRRPIERAVSLAPSVTEMIFAAGAGDRLVGVTTYCDYPESAKRIEKVGDTQTPNIERIIALKPDVVFVSTSSQLEAFMKTLEEQGISVYVTNPADLNGVMGNLRTFGSLFGTETIAGDLITALDYRAYAVDQRVKGMAPPKVFIQISNEPLFTIGKDSFLTQIVARAGGVSVTEDVPTAYPKLSKETAAAMDPDVIILSDSEDNREPNAAFRNSPAMKNGRVYRVNADIISRPGPRLVNALEEISKRLPQ